MNPKTRALMEAASDIAFIAGRRGYYTGDSREDISNFIQWAIEFENLRKESPEGEVTYNDLGYMEAIEKFSLERLGETKRLWNLAPLPADPDGMNRTRSEHAASALRQYQLEVQTDDEDAVTDLLGDLMHFCDHHQQDFLWQLQRARLNYLRETDSTTLPIPRTPLNPPEENEPPF